MRERPGQVLKLSAYEQLKDEIITCRLMPGQVLSEQLLAEELGMSRTPIREALVRLAQDSLVRLAPRRGAFVAELSIQDIVEIFELREAIETWVVRKVAGRVPEERLAAFEEVFQHPGTDAERTYPAQDREFHRYLVSLAANRRCEALFQNLRDQDQRIRVLASLQPGRLEATLTEHMKIVEALRRGAGEEAAAVMAEHIRNARMVAMRLL